MNLQHRGLSIELAEDDARIPVIEALLFGRTLPPPLPPPPEPVVPAPPPPPPPDPLSEPLRRFWKELAKIDRRELLLLCAGPLRPPALEKALGVPQSRVMGGHSRIGRLASKHGVPVRVRTRGRVRSDKRYYLADEVIALVELLDAESQRADQAASA